MSESFAHKMAAKTSWHRYESKLRHCHPMYTCTYKLMLCAKFHCDKLLNVEDIEDYTVS